MPTLKDIRNRLWQEKKFTPFGWMMIVLVSILLSLASASVRHRREKQAGMIQELPSGAIPRTSARHETAVTIPEAAPLVATPPPPSPAGQAILPQRPLNQPSFGNLNPSGKIMSDDFLPKGTMLHATLTSDIVSNNQISPATATVIHPVIFAHRVRIPVGTQLTGRIAPGNLRGRVFVTWDTLIFYEEGRQGWELPMKGIGMTYEESPESGRWRVNGAGLKGYVYDDAASTAFKLASLRGMQDFTKTLQTFITTQNSAITAGSTLTTTTTTPESTLRNSGLAAIEGFIDVIAGRYAAQLQQQNSYVLVPTARLCAIFLDEAIDITSAAPGRSLPTR